MASRQELINSISTEMKLHKSLFIEIYGFELTWPGFAEKAIKQLELVGCSKAKEYYSNFVSEYEKEHDEVLKNVAEWYKKQNSIGKAVNGSLKEQKKINLLKKKLQLLKKKSQLLRAV